MLGQMHIHDHASIATEAKVVAKLKEKGIDKNDLTREEFMSHAWDWTNEYGGVILKYFVETHERPIDSLLDEIRNSHH